MTQLTPLADRLVAEPVEVGAKTASGLYLPSDAKEKSQLAKVVATGKDVKEVKVGNTVLYKEFSSEHTKVEGKEYVLLKEEDVLAIVKS